MNETQTKQKITQQRSVWALTEESVMDNGMKLGEIWNGDDCNVTGTIIRRVCTNQFSQRFDKMHIMASNTEAIPATRKRCAANIRTQITLADVLANLKEEYK